MVKIFIPNKRKEPLNLRLLLGMPDRESVGGPAACEPPFAAALRRMSINVSEETYVFGEKLARVGTARRVRRVISTALRLRRRIRAERFEVLHLNTSFDTKALLRDVVTLSLLPSGRSKVFLKFHGSDADLLQTKNPLLRSLVRRLLSRADGIGVLSSEERGNFLRAGIDEHKTFVIKNVVRSETMEPNSASRLRLNLPEDVPLLLFIARFIPAKGLLDVIHACRILRDRGQDFRLLCVGDGPLRVQGEAEVVRLGLQADVHFFGLIAEEEAAKFYTNSTMLVFPTYHYEGFPMVVFNSLASGLPIITTRIRAAADYLHEPENCLWVEPKNPEMLAEKIAGILSRPELQKTMAENNRRLAAQFNATVVTNEYLEIYQRILAIRE
jgi:glycosyltransferase involved in cell wall biosynthesis